MLCHWSKALVFPLLDEGREAKKQTDGGQSEEKRQEEGKQTDRLQQFQQRHNRQCERGMEGWRDGADGGMEAQVDVELDTNQWRRLLEEVENKDATMSLKKAQNCKNF